MGNKLPRPIILGLIVGVLAILAAVALYVRSHRAPPMVDTDLTADEVKDALSVLQQERATWARFKGLSGHIRVVCEAPGIDPRTIAGRISLRQVDPKSAFKYEMTLSDEQDRWRFTTDGTKKNSHLVCQDEQLAATIDGMSLWALAGLLVDPKILLLPLYKDSLWPQGRGPFDELLTYWMPRHNERAPRAVQSYAFKHLHGKPTELFFCNGHYSGWQTEAHEGDPAIVTFAEAPVESSGFWYPTHIQTKVQNVEFRIDLSELDVDAHD